MGTAKGRSALIDEVLTGRRVRLRPATPADESALTEIFTDPEVARWWGDPARSVRDVLNPEEGESCFIVEAGAEPIGMIQCLEEGDPMYRHAGIDIAIRSEWQGQGFGPDAIRALAQHLLAVRGHHRLTIDPAADNTRAIKAYERVGFKPVGIMRQYERGADGTWHDGLLMELLADELAHS